MREALHIGENKLYRLPVLSADAGLANLKQLAKKGLFQCPHCKAEVRVKSGEKREVHFSHLHSESCEESKVVEKAEKKYVNQIKRETLKHQTMVMIVHDELHTQSRVRGGMLVDFGYKAKAHLSEFPDVWVGLEGKEFAVSIVTNVNPRQDTDLSKKIIKRHQYFIEQGMTPIWFIENKELAIEKDKNAIVLWDAEAAIALKTEEDSRWDSLLTDIIKDPSFFELFNYVPSMEEISIDVRSMYYIYSSEDRIVVKVQRFMNDRLKKPFRSFLINEGYEISFAEALKLHNNFFLCNPAKEEENRKQFIESFNVLSKKREEMELLKQKEEEERRKKLEQEKEEMHERLLEEKRKAFLEQQKLNTMTYNELKQLLKERIGLTQSEQMELWTKYMPTIGIKNSQKVWDIVEEQNVGSFGELRQFLKEIS